MAGFAPFLQDSGNLTVRANPNIQGTYNQIMSRTVVEPGRLVVGNAHVLVMPAFHKFAHRTLDQTRKVAGDEPGVLPGELDLTRKRQVITTKYRGAGDDARGECLIVTVAQTKHPAVIQVGLPLLDLHEAKVAHAVMAEAVRLCADDQSVTADSVLDIRDEVDMGDWSPAFGGSWGGNIDDLMAFREAGAAVQSQIGTGTMSEGGGLKIEICDHD